MKIKEAIAILEAGRYNEVKYLEAKNLAVKALEMQTAKPVEEPESMTNHWKVCPNCNHFVERYEQSHGRIEIPYCKWCGQKLDWGKQHE